MWILQWTFISGLMFGLELAEPFQDEPSSTTLIIDIGIIRIMIYKSYMDDDNEDDDDSSNNLTAA